MTIKRLVVIENGEFFVSRETKWPINIVTKPGKSTFVSNVEKLSELEPAEQACYWFEAEHLHLLLFQTFSSPPSMCAMIIIHIRIQATVS